jgi:hypothetical protein
MMNECAALRLENATLRQNLETRGSSDMDTDHAHLPQAEDSQNSGLYHREGGEALIFFPLAKPGVFFAPNRSQDTGSQFPFFSATMFYLLCQTSGSCRSGQDSGQKIQAETSCIFFLVTARDFSVLYVPFFFSLVCPACIIFPSAEVFFILFLYAFFFRMIASLPQSRYKYFLPESSSK